MEDVLTLENKIDWLLLFEEKGADKKLNTCEGDNHKTHRTCKLLE